MKNTRFNHLLSLIIICSFIVGFIFQENSSGGANDFNHYYNNFVLFKNNNFFDIEWKLYESSSMPLYYLVSYFFFNPDNLALLKFFNLVLSIFCVYLFYIILVKKLKFEKSLIFLLSTTLLLSPYFRTGTYWMMEENFPILMTLLTIYFYLSFKNKFNYIKLLLVIFFSACAFFSRQNYIFVGAGLFLLIFDWDKFISKNNFIIILFYLFFFSPILYFFNIWGGVIPPIVVDEERVFINFYNFPYIMNIILIYTLPFLYLEKNIKTFLLNNKFLILIFLLIYLLLFSRFIPQSFGGGAINKLLFIIFNGELIKYTILISSFISLLILFLLFKNNKFIILFFVINILIFSTITPVWQEYFDPLCIIFLLIFCNKLNSFKKSLIFARLLVFYLVLFLGASLIDQNFII